MRISDWSSDVCSSDLDVAPFIDALDRVLALVARLAAQGIQLRHLDVGGGLGVRYHDEQPIAPRDWAAALRPKLQATGLKIYTEPGHAIAGNAGILVTRVLGLKGNEDKRFAEIGRATCRERVCQHV